MRFWRRSAKPQRAAVQAPGWYRFASDPPGFLRWWDGAQWTSELRDTQLGVPSGRPRDHAAPRASDATVIGAPMPERLVRIPLPANGRQAVAGEKYRQRALRRVTRGMRLPEVTGDNWDESVSMTAELHPEPENPHDDKAVRVEINGNHVGYLPAYDAPNYQPILLSLAGEGTVGTCEARLMIGPTRDISVYLHLGSPEDVAFVVHAPDNSVPILGDRITTVTGEENHQDFLRRLATASNGTESCETAKLGLCRTEKGKFAGQEAIEVRLGDERVGQLTRAMTERYEHLVRDALNAGKTPICRALVSTTPGRGVQVQLLMPRPSMGSRDPRSG